MKKVVSGTMLTSLRRILAVGVLSMLLMIIVSVVPAVTAPDGTGIWIPMADTPGTWGFGLVYDGGDYLYAIVDGSLVRYSISEDSWETLTTPPKSPIGWVGLAYVAGKIYLSTSSIMGNWFLCYDIALGT